jgi:NADH dehydrogenase FAD-containing subunit
MSKKSDDQDTVIVVGGGGAGIKLCHDLAPKLDPAKYKLVLITQRSFHVHLPALPRMAVTSEGNLEDSAFMPYDKMFTYGNASIRQGTVEAIEAHESGGGKVTLYGGEKLQYRILILCPGSTWEGPINLPLLKEEALQSINEWRARFKAAKSVILVGGGAVGIELAGELKDCYPDKPVTIVHNGAQLLNDTYSTKFRARLEASLRQRGVHIILNDHIEKIPDLGVDSTVTTHGGVNLNADLILPTRGGRPNTQFISSLGEDVLDKDGRVRVNSYFQVKKHPNIFVAGDAPNVVEQKQLAKCAKHAAVIVPNVLSVLNGGEAKSFYKGATEVIVVTNGRNRGAGFIKILCGISLGDRLVSLIKGKGLFINLQRKDLGLASM